MYVGIPSRKIIFEIEFKVITPPPAHHSHFHNKSFQLFKKSSDKKSCIFASKCIYEQQCRQFLRIVTKKKIGILKYFYLSCFFYVTVIFWIWILFRETHKYRGVLILIFICVKVEGAISLLGAAANTQTGLWRIHLKVQYFNDQYYSRYTYTYEYYTYQLRGPRENSYLLNNQTSACCISSPW